MDVCTSSSSPSWPSLYIPRTLDQEGTYLCTTSQAWRFTTIWTLILYAAMYLAAAGYAGIIHLSSTHGEERAVSKDDQDQPIGDATGKQGDSIALQTMRMGSISRILDASEPGRRVGKFVTGTKRNWKITLLVGVGYVVIGGAEAVLAGSVVGALLGTAYNAGGFKLSTWVPLVWAVINVLFLLLSSFSIQERLL